jgi:hypothetical protein
MRRGLSINEAGSPLKYGQLLLHGTHVAIGSSLPLESLSLQRDITVEAWITSETPSAEVMQAIVSQWRPASNLGDFDAFDAGAIDGLNSTGYFGAVFDGRYVYFAPEQHASLDTHAVVLRYDTHSDFHAPSSYAAYDASRTNGLDVRGFYGAAFDGTYVYFVPRQLGTDRYHSRILRFDTRAEFRNASSWSAFDVGLEQSAQGAAFDGRYLYLAPGYQGDPKKEDEYCSTVIRYDTRAPFHSGSSYATADVMRLAGPGAACFDGASFDGRYVYFVPLFDHVAIRYDTHAGFNRTESWQRMDLAPLGAGLFVGSVFDGRYLYYVPYANSVAIRFDTTADYADPAAWEATDVGGTDGLATSGFDGGFFDGRYVYFIPFVSRMTDGSYAFHTHLLRFDPRRAFADRGAWRACDGSMTAGLRTTGYNAGAFDGRYFYFAPWQQGRDGETKQLLVHGKVLRYDTLGSSGAFSLRHCDIGHNGGLNAAVPGPSFLINTESGVKGVAAHQILSPGRHHLAGTYDGEHVRLYIDGSLAASRRASGKLLDCDNVPITVGHLCDGMSEFRGRIHAVRLSDTSHDAERMRQSAGESFWDQ